MENESNISDVNGYWCIACNVYVLYGEVHICTPQWYPTEEWFPKEYDPSKQTQDIKCPHCGKRIRVVKDE